MQLAAVIPSLKDMLGLTTVIESYTVGYKMSLCTYVVFCPVISDYDTLSLTLLYTDLSSL